MELRLVWRLAKDRSSEVFEVVPADRFGLVAQRCDVGKSTVLESYRVVDQVHQACDGLARSPMANHARPTLGAFVKADEL